MAESVYRVATQSGQSAYVRPDDGSSGLLARLVGTNIPAPRPLEMRGTWLLLSAVPGTPLSHPTWLARPKEAAAIAADALRRLDTLAVRHGDMCLPNILGDLATGQLGGIVDWRYASQTSREIDVASAVWSSGYNGYGPDIAIAILQGCHWPVADAVEVARLSDVWIAHAGPPAEPRELAL